MAHIYIYSMYIYMCILYIYTLYIYTLYIYIHYIYIMFYLFITWREKRREMYRLRCCGSCFSISGCLPLYRLFSSSTRKRGKFAKFVCKLRSCSIYICTCVCERYLRIPHCGNLT